MEAVRLSRARSGLWKPSLFSAVPFAQEPRPLILGERTNANGSKAFRDRLAADDIEGMVAIARELPPDQGRLLLQIHDELIFEVPEKHLDEVTELVTARMENILPLRVPLKVNGASGPTWEAIT